MKGVREMYQVLGQHVLICRRGGRKLAQGHREGIHRKDPISAFKNTTGLRGLHTSDTNSFPTPNAQHTSGRIGMSLPAVAETGPSCMRKTVAGWRPSPAGERMGS